MKEEFDREIAMLKKQLKASEAENKKLMDTLIRRAKGADPATTAP
jgi:hypothetical protein